MKREPRLQFSDADLAEPKLEKPIKRVKKAEAKADKAQAKIPKKTVVKKERGFDPATGKVKTQLRFEEVDKKKPPSKLTHAVQDAPANLILSQVHREVRQSEDDNVGVEAAHKVELWPHVEHWARHVSHAGFAGTARGRDLRICGRTVLHRPARLRLSRHDRQNEGQKGCRRHRQHLQGQDGSGQKRRTQGKV